MFPPSRHPSTGHYPSSGDAGQGIPPSGTILGMASHPGMLVLGAVSVGLRYLSNAGPPAE